MVNIHWQQFFGNNKERLHLQKVDLGDVGTLLLSNGVCTSITFPAKLMKLTIRNSGIITLPSTRTLQDYKHLSSTAVGFSVEADKQLLDILNQKDDLAKYCVLLFDEMYIKQGLVLREKSTGFLFGFTDLGDISNQLDEFMQSFKDHSESLPRPLAKAMLVFMVK